jgi:hypothetical protein
MRSLVGLIRFHNLYLIFSKKNLKLKKKEFLDVKNVAANVIVRKLYTNIGGT